MSINLIACINRDSALGKDNQLLYRFPNDLKRFKELTSNHEVVMGRKTYESIGEPLPNRTNIVLSRDYEYDPDYEVYVYHSVDDILREYENYAEKQVEIWVIGGEQIYKQFLPYCDRIYLTIIDHAGLEADSYFPAFDINHYRIIEHTRNAPDEKHPYPYHFVTYERKI
jgi:dihydrofolate reductase